MINDVFESFMSNDEETCEGETCGCGHHHDEDHECGCGHHHDEDHGCGCVHHHDEGHECGCGHHHDEDHECGCGHHHELIILREMRGISFFCVFCRIYFYFKITYNNKGKIVRR